MDRTSARAALVTIALVVTGTATSPAHAIAAPVTTTTGDAKMSALDGWLVWSEPQADGWHLVGLKDGVRRMIPARPRPVPFDVDLGTAADGRVVATYTRCRTSPAGGYPSVGSGCRIRVLDLVTGVERSAGIPRPTGASDATPSMHRGRIAFSRLSPAHGQVMQILLWDARTRHTRRLPHGPMPDPHRCPFATGCEHEPRRGTVTALDLGDRLVAFAWHVVAPGVAGSGGSTVLQAVSLRTRSSRTLGSGVAGEACTGGIDGSTPLTPTVVGASAVWYLQRAGACEKSYAWIQRGIFGGGIGQADLPASTLQATTDGHRVYTLVAPMPGATSGQYSPPEYHCDRPAAPCTITEQPFPRLRRLTYTPKLSTYR